MSKCTDLVIRLASERGLSLPKDDLRLIVTDVEKQVAGKTILSESQYNEAISLAVENLSQKKIALRQMKLEALLRVLKTNELKNRIEKYDGEDIDGLLTFLRGESKLRVGSRDSLAAKTQAAQNQFISELEISLNEKGKTLRAALESGKFDKEIYQYAYDLAGGKKPSDIDVSPEAKLIHEAIFNSSNGIRERINRSGGFIGFRDDRIVTQSHDMKKIKDAGFEQWRNDFESLIDKQRTFANLTNQQERDKYLLELYNRFITGKHYLADDGRTEVSFRPTATNLAKKISQKRQIHFKDGKAAFEYATKYSDGKIWDKLIGDITKSSRSVTLLENLGPNPKAALDNVIESIEKDALAKGASVPNVKIKQVQAEFEYLNGLHDIPSNVTLAEVGHTFRALESLSKLGGAVLAAGPDLVFKAATLNRRTDMGFFGSTVKAMTDVVGGVPKADREHISNMFGIYAEVVTGKVFSRFGATDGMPGRMSQLQQKFFQWNFLQGWTMSHKKGIVAAHSHDLARYRNTDFDALPPNTKRNLELYNVSADEWNILRNGETLNPETGNHFITPETINSLSDDVIDPVIQRLQGTTDITDNMRMQFKDTVRTKFLTMATDIADEGVVTPGQRERVLMTLGTQKGTVLGEFMRFVGQFKAFPVTVITKQMMPQYYSAGGGVRGVASLIPIIIATTALGYVSGAAKDLAKGRQPRDPKDSKTWADALVRGGGLGLFGDFMFNEYSRYGRSFQESLLGPGIGTFSDAVALAHKTAMLKADAGDYFSFMKNITPGQNLFYTEAAFNYLFFYGLMEMNDPGYISRIEKRRRNDFEQEFWLDPTESAVRF